jgi:type IV secretory pathway TraG/TraD family ATPase VirD4
MSRLTGQREIIEKREGFSYGANDIRDGVSVQQERRKEPLILDAEFLKLNDCEAYMLLPENTPATKITLTAKNRPELSKVLVPRKSPKLSLTIKTKKPPATNRKADNTEETISQTPIAKKSIITTQISSKELVVEPDF